MNPGTLPTQLPTLPYMPAELVGLITPEHFMFTSALTGMLCGFAIWLIWSRGL